jgi:predicted amidophosphoribosyltransferase
MPVPLRPAYRMYRWLWSGLDLLYPPACGGCGAQGERWCASCQAKTVMLRPGRLPGLRPGRGPLGIMLPVPGCAPQYTRLRSWAEYAGPLRHALHRLKYNKDMALGEVLARPLVGCLRSLDWPVDTLLPVPLGVARFAQRGYNQSALLARPLALAMNIPYRPAGLRRPARDPLPGRPVGRAAPGECQRRFPRRAEAGAGPARPGRGRYRHQRRHPGRLRGGPAGSRRSERLLPHRRPRRGVTSE